MTSAVRNSNGAGILTRLIDNNTFEYGSSQCPLCNFTAVSLQKIISHIRTVHSNDPRFKITCGLEGCAASTYKSFSALYSHLYRHHQWLIKKRKGETAESEVELSGSGEAGADPRSFINNTATPCSISGSEADLGEDTGGDFDETIKRNSALFILKLKEHYKITQSALSFIIEGFNTMFFQIIEHLRKDVYQNLEENEEYTSRMDFRIKSPFQGLETSYLQERYFEDKLNLLKPHEIRIGEPRYVPRFSGAKRKLVEQFDTFHYVPLQPTLKTLLDDYTIIEQIDNPHSRSDGLKEDYCDGTLFKQHPLFSKDPYALQLIAHYDELEVSNPLGSHVKKHKVGVVSFTLGNIIPKYRSKLRAINLAIVAKVSIVETYGLSKVLEPFISDINTLTTTGIEVMNNGKKRIFKGALLAFLADNLASNDLGGFKKSFSFSFRFCRACMVTSDSLVSSFASEGFQQRHEFTHKNHLKCLDGPLDAHYSKVYGINNRSGLLDVKYYSIFGGGLPFDCMHDFLEGVIPSEVKLLLNQCISSKYFTLDEFNDRMSSFNYGYSESSKPIPILSQTLKSSGKSLRLSASEMLLLTYLLPFIIGEKIPTGDHYWNCFLCLRKILDLVLSPVVSENYCSSLKLNIVEHHTKFVDLYGKEFYTPKMHFILHYPEQMQQLGPMIRTWNMRNEAKLHFFKKAAHLSNFKNISLTLSSRHQRWMCYELASKNLLEEALECGPSISDTTLVKNQSELIQTELSLLAPYVSQETAVSHPAWINVHGIHYECNNAFLVLKVDGTDPVFGRLDNILVIGGSFVVYCLSMCTTLYFEDHYHAYAIKVTLTKKLATLSALQDHNVYHAHKLKDKELYITLKHII